MPFNTLGIILCSVVLNGKTRMVKVENLSDGQLDKLIDRLNQLINMDSSVEENDQKLNMLIHEKQLRELQTQNRLDLIDDLSLGDYILWRDGDTDESDLPMAMVVDDITITSNTVRINREALSLYEQEKIKANEDIKIIRKKKEKKPTATVNKQRNMRSSSRNKAVMRRKTDDRLQKVRRSESSTQYHKKSVQNESSKDAFPIWPLIIVSGVICTGLIIFLIIISR